MLPIDLPDLSKPSNTSPNHGKTNILETEISENIAKYPHKPLLKKVNPLINSYNPFKGR